MTEFFDPLETRDPGEREAALLRRIAGADRRRADHHGLRRDPAWRRRQRPSLRARRWRSCRSRASTNCSNARRRSAAATPSAAFRPSAGAGRVPRGARAACSSRRARSTNPKAMPPTTGASAAPCLPRAFVAGDLVHNSFSYHLTPAGSMMETGAHGHRLHGLPRRRGQHRAAAAGHARAACRRLRRHAQLPAHRAGEGR